MTEAPANRPSARGGLFPIVVAVLLSALLVEGFLLLRPKPSRPREAQQAIASGKAQQVETFGDPSAPIEIKLYAPLTLPWHVETIGLLRQYHKDHPGRIRVLLMPMGQAECDAEMEKRGYTCAVILINGKDEFTLPDRRQVTLQKRPNQPSSTYNSQDVITILNHLRSAEGPPQL